MNYDFDLIVIGSGAGGSVGAHHAISLGKKVAVFEAGAIGGECPNFGCVPTKGLLQAAETYENAKAAGAFGIKIGELSFDYPKIRSWKDLVVSHTGAAHGEESFQKEGIALIREKAVLTSAHTVEADGKAYSAEFILLATGTEVFIPPIAGLEESGYITFKEAIDFTSAPKSIFILGGGPIGVEFAQIFSTFGSEVYLCDTLPRLLAREDQEMGELIGALFQKRGIKILVGATVNKVTKNSEQKSIYYSLDGKEGIVNAEQILVATGKKPVLSFAPERAGIQVDKKGVVVNEFLQTNVTNIFAAGDIVGPYLFTHTGYYQSYLAVHNAFSQEKIKADYSAVPRCIFTHPEAAAVGITQEQAAEKGLVTKVGAAPISILGRANTTNEFDGFVKVLTGEDGTLVGASIVSPRAGEMIHELALAIKLKVKASVIAEMIHAYPTFSEAVKIACANVE
ncbi:MAG: hypothetical protein A3F35_00995 [Candidatus Woykebacteria bacterium RIFCSPHIGHO2_12_FULL_45_10]|uniref:Dihydrolipoyl dehydrogenase n=1 Tax=Candidatus Woykebacteria bacterium RIFCSPHIGHO2_12_FULL_45_10 TaxID=1802603 RepID=A0A1G1WRE2_9BACT|nr:MAG: hypothetical protein A3F35_00995 [Candidatus Woykebacteria bacterium RIFCSPHIGHO2_12_FULL_45_10]